jgi:hypothetical protein
VSFEEAEKPFVAHLLSPQIKNTGILVLFLTAQKQASVQIYFGESPNRISLGLSNFSTFLFALQENQQWLCISKKITLLGVLISHLAPATNLIIVKNKCYFLRRNPPVFVILW